MSHAKKFGQPRLSGSKAGFAGRELLVDALRHQPIPGFEITGTLGKGGMNTVHLARDSSGREVALKLLRKREEGDEFFHLNHWFVRECAATMILSHPNIVSALAFGNTEEYLYLSMERLDGKPLYRYIKRFGGLDWATTRSVMIGVLGGLEEMHRAGVIHRDLKPENIVVFPTRDGPRNPKIIDFGLCHIDGFSDFWPSLASDIPVPARVTPAGASFATPEFRAPEFRLDGATHSPAVDIYAAGLTFYNTVAGRLPFVIQALQDPGERSAYYANIHSHLVFPHPVILSPHCELPERAGEVLMSAIEKEPSSRPTAAEMRRIIESC